MQNLVFEQQLQLWEWMAAYYMCSEGEVMAAALPRILNYPVKPYWFIMKNMAMIFQRWIMMNIW